jgi:hypothetical protein
MASKTFFGILFGVPLATALGIEAASFWIFLDLVQKKIKKIQPKARPFFPARFSKPCRYQKKERPSNDYIVH